MKIAFSNAAFPEQTLDTLIERANAWGYQGFELTGFHGYVDLPSVPALRDEPEVIQRKLRDAEQTIVALDPDLCLFTGDRGALRGARSLLLRCCDLASAIGCPLVVVRGARRAPHQTHETMLYQGAAVLQELAPEAASRGVSLAIQNAGQLVKSQDMWYLWDAVQLPVVRFAWEIAKGAEAGEPPSVVVPRLAGGLALVRTPVELALQPADEATSAASGEKPSAPAEIPPLGFQAGGGDGRVTATLPEVAPRDRRTNLPHVLELLKGVAYSGWICVHTPPRTDAENALRDAAQFLQAEIAKPVVVLSAYKGDKHAPRFVAARHATHAAGSA